MDDARDYFLLLAVGRIIFPVLVVINDGIGEIGSDGILGAATSSAGAGAGLGQGAGQDDNGSREFHGWLAVVIAIAVSTE